MFDYSTSTAAIKVRLQYEYCCYQSSITVRVLLLTNILQYELSKFGTRYSSTSTYFSTILLKSIVVVIGNSRERLFHIEDIE